MTYAPASLLALRSYLQPLTGLSAVSLGIVGDTAHAAKGTSYHLGADKLSATAYSRVTARDKAGLSNAASAIDIGNFPRLRAMSMWLVEEARRNAPGTSDMREIIYSPDGVAVLRWDRERGYASAPRAGEADASHRGHSHVSWYRDAEKRDHVIAFRGFFEEATLRSFTYVLGQDSRPITGTVTTPATVAVGTKFLRLGPDTLHDLPAGWDRTATKVRLTEPIVAGKPTTDDWMLGWLVMAGSAPADASFVLARNCTFTPYPPVDCSAEVAQAWETGKAAAIAGAQGATP